MAMPVKPRMTVEEYLTTSFDDADCEYLDGEVVERNMGELPHSFMQGYLAHLFQRAAEQGVPIQFGTEPRMRVSPTRFRIPDVAVWRSGPIGRRLPTVPPFIVVEILSRDDRLVRVMQKVREYLAFGVEHIWLIDPDERRAMCYSPADPAGSECEVLRTQNPDLEIRLADLLAYLDAHWAE